VAAPVRSRLRTPVPTYTPLAARVRTWPFVSGAEKLTSDAVVVVASEETGAISYAYKGQLVRGLSLEHLRAFLTTVFVRDPKSQSLTEWLRTRRGFGWFHRPVASAKPGAPVAKA